MYHITYYLLACTMVLTTVTCRHANFTVKWGIGYQCKSRGYAGACDSQNERDGELICASLACAKPQMDGSYSAIYTKPVEDGTSCGMEKVCVNGQCVVRNRSVLQLLYTSGIILDCVTLGPPKRHGASLRVKLLTSLHKRQQLAHKEKMRNQR